MNTYETRSVFRAFRGFFIRRGAMAGTCPSVCDDICNHKPCIDDFEVEEELQECICIPDGETRCGGNTQCASDQCRCLSGYEGNPLVSGGACTDINECTAGSNNCGANSLCTNLPGSFNCTCLKGFEGNPVAGCTDIDECSANPNICGAFGTCANTDGAYRCDCAPGYQWDAPFGICNDINECITTNCGTNANCTNTPGSFKCNCNIGYFSTGQPPLQPCNDIDECREIPNLCGNNATCANTAGSFRCRCNRGFVGAAPFCTPDECTVARNGTVCGENTQCVNATQPPSCQCLSGYSGNANVSCTDIDECASPTACPTTTRCINSAGSFECLITEFNECPTKRDSTCVSGLKCAQESRSVSTYRCCSSTGSCAGGVCCNGAYIENEACPSRNSLDCASGLTCAPVAIFSSRYICCRNTLFGICV